MNANATDVPGPRVKVPRDWTLRESGGVAYYELTGLPGLFIAFVTRSGGVSRGVWETLNLSFDVGDCERHVRRNWNRLRTATHLPKIITLRQTHSDTVIPVADEWTPSETIEGDASFTGLLNTGLGIRVADCLPVYVFSADGSCVGIAHCGWRGTVSRIAEKVARQMSRCFAVPLSSLFFALGPSICPGCYSVGEDVMHAFSERFPAGSRFVTPTVPGRNRNQFALDIRAANRWLLAETGLTEAGSHDGCTFEGVAEFYSARRDGRTGRNLAVIALRAPAGADPEPA